jgi:exopolysaccharide biosynthesis WecB/TagA/CpsF family protein
MSINMPVDDYDLTAFTAVASRFDPGSYGFVVTPNVDHLIRYCDDSSFRDLYAQAAYVLLDSRILAHLVKLCSRIRPPVCPGSDLTSVLFDRVIAPHDRIVLVGASAEQAQLLRSRFGLADLRHIEPPMGFIRDPVAVEACLRAIEAASPFRFCLLAIGCPQQEIIGARLKQRGVARGLALCIGASINFLTGAERRAPRWMQRFALEWLFRLLQDPRRLARRYLMRGPRIFLLLPRIRWQLRAQAR